MYEMQEEEFDKLEERSLTIKDERKIVQSNFIIERKHRLSIQATLLLFTLTSMIQKDDEDFKRYKIDVSDFSKYWDYDQKNSYKAIESALDELGKSGLKKYSINLDTGRTIVEGVGGFISYYRYEYGEGYALVAFDPHLKDDYLGLNRDFTAFMTQNIRKMYLDGALSSTIRTYEILRQYLVIGYRKLTVLEYKELLGMVERNKKGIVSEKYKGNNANLKTKVLEPAKEKINGNTDIVIDYEIKGRGSSAEILFTIKGAKVETIETNFIEKRFPEKMIRKLLGLGERALTQKEKTMFTQWFETWRFTEDIVTLAFEKTVDTISRADINYINAILRRWNHLGYSSIEEIEKKDSKFISSNSSFDEDEFIKVALCRAWDD